MSIAEKDKDFSKFFHVIIDDGTWAKWSLKTKAVYAVINRFANYKTRSAIPTIKTIVRLAGVSKDSVSEAINEIEKAGYFSVKRGGQGIGFRNIYSVHNTKTSTSLINNIYRKKTGRCSYHKDPVTGKFASTGEKNRVPTREKTANDTSREITGEKENLDLSIIDSAGSASACSMSQASPALKAFLGKVIPTGDFELLFGIESMKEEVIRLVRTGEIRLEPGVDLDEVINSSKDEKNESYKKDYGKTPNP